MHTDQGPDEPREVFALITADCAESKEAECRQQILLGGCEAQADALINVSSRVARGSRRMIADAVEYVPGAAAPRSSGGGATP